MEYSVLHVMMFPWLAQGHIAPFLELSKRLAEQGFRISFLSTGNISKIKFSIDEKWVGKINMKELPLSFVEGLPPDADNTADISIEKAEVLKIALDGLEIPFEHLLRRIQPDYIIHDFPQYWAATVAAKFVIPAIYFCIFSAAAMGSAATVAENPLGERGREGASGWPGCGENPHL